MDFFKDIGRRESGLEGKTDKEKNLTSFFGIADAVYSHLLKAIDPRHNL
jgi:hypothetical protein